MYKIQNGNVNIGNNQTSRTTIRPSNPFHGLLLLKEVDMYKKYSAILHTERAIKTPRTARLGTINNNVNNNHNKKNKLYSKIKKETSVLEQSFRNKHSNSYIKSPTITSPSINHNNKNNTNTNYKKITNNKPIPKNNTNNLIYIKRYPKNNINNIKLNQNEISSPYHEHINTEPQNIITTHNNNEMSPLLSNNKTINITNTSFSTDFYGSEFKLNGHNIQDNDERTLPNIDTTPIKLNDNNSNHIITPKKEERINEIEFLRNELRLKNLEIQTLKNELIKYKNNNNVNTKDITNFNIQNTHKLKYNLQLIIDKYGHLNNDNESKLKEILMDLKTLVLE